jgi:small subunit ribosomal protein S6
MVSEEVVKKEEAPTLHRYEMVIIVSPEVAEEKFEATIDNISRYITGKGGVVSDVQRWGKRKLAYPIKHFMEGSYVLIQFTLKTDFCKELEANLRISEEVLRHLLIKLDG